MKLSGLVKQMIIVSLLLAGSACTAAEPVPVGQVKGVLWDVGTDGPAAGVPVRLYSSGQDKDDIVYIQTLTDRNGAFLFEGVTSTQFWLHATLVAPAESALASTTGDFPTLPSDQGYDYGTIPVRLYDTTDLAAEPLFVNHTPLDFSLPDLGAGKQIDWLSGNSGCDELQERSDLQAGLNPSYPVMGCFTRGLRCSNTNTAWMGYWYTPGDNCLHWAGGMMPLAFRLLVFDGEGVVVVTTEAQLRDLYAPIETMAEALSYAKAATGLSAFYGLEEDTAICNMWFSRLPCRESSPDYEYLTPIIEDTYVMEALDGYFVHLFQYAVFSCIHPVSAVDLYVARDGQIRQVAMTTIYYDTALGCVD